MVEITFPQDAAVSSPLKYLWWLVRAQTKRVIFGAGVSCGWMLGLAIVPALLARAIDQGLEPGDMRSLFLWSGCLLVLGILNAWLAILRHRTMTRVRMDANFRTSYLVVEQVNRLGAGLSRRVTAGEVATIGLVDVLTIGRTLTVTGPGIASLLAYLAVAVLLYGTSPLLALVVLLGVPLVLLAVGPFLNRLRGTQTTYRQSQARLTALLLDTIEGLPVLNAFGGKAAFANKYKAQSTEVRDQGYRVGAVASWIDAASAGLPAVFLAAVTWLAASMAGSGAISIGEFVAVYGYVSVLVIPVSFLIEGAGDLSRGLVAARRATHFLNLHPVESEKPPTRSDVDVQAPLIDPTSGVRAQPGLFTALVSSRPEEYLDILERLSGYVQSDAQWGATRLDQVSPGAVRHHIVLADQEAWLFAGPLRSTLDVAADRQDSEIYAALQAAVADDLWRTHPDGLERPIVARARNLSGGQRQRVRLARALLARPHVLLMSDPTSALDAHTEAMVASRLRAAREGATTVIGTTAPALLGQSDAVHFLVDGRVVDSGDHQSLLAVNPDYRAVVGRGVEEEYEKEAGATR
jgi:ABC-type multidrug transport system fused ATPase/permease subunit